MPSTFLGRIVFLRNTAISAVTIPHPRSPEHPTSPILADSLTLGPSRRLDGICFAQIPPIGGRILKNILCNLIVGGVLDADGMNVAVIKRQKLRTRIRHQDRRMRRQDELACSRPHHTMHLCEKKQLALWRQCRFWLVQRKSQSQTVLNNGKKGLSMRLRMERTSAIGCIRISPKIRIAFSLVEQRCKISIKPARRK